MSNEITSQSIFQFLSLVPRNSYLNIPTFLSSNFEMEYQVEEIKEISQLRQSVINGDVTEVKNLVADGADIYEQFKGCCIDGSGLALRKHSPIHCAIFWNQIEMVEFFIQNGLNMNHSSLIIPLLSLAFMRQMENRNEPWDMIELLVENGFDINYQDKFTKHTALHWAAIIESIDIAQYLISKGAKISPLDKHNWTPLNIAIYTKNEALAKYLIENGSDLTNITMPRYFYSIGTFEKTSVLKMTITKGLPALTELIIEKLRERPKTKDITNQIESLDMTDKEEFLNDKKECVVCTQPRDGLFAFVPCGHTKTCYACCVILTDATYNPKCPICREKIEKIMKIYL